TRTAPAQALPGRRRRGGSATAAATSPIAACLAHFPSVPGAEIGADGVHAVKMLRDEIHVVHCDAEPLLDENHQPEQAQRIKDAGLEQRRRVSKRQQARVLDEFLADEVVDDGFQLTVLPCAVRLSHVLPTCHAPQGRCGPPCPLTSWAVSRGTPRRPAPYSPAGADGSGQPPLHG